MFAAKLQNSQTYPPRPVLSTQGLLMSTVQSKQVNVVPVFLR